MKIYQKEFNKILVYARTKKLIVIFCPPNPKYCNNKSGNSLKNNCGYKGSVCCGLSKADKKGPVNAWNELINYKKLAFKRGREFEDKRVCSKIQTNTKKSFEVLEFRKSFNPLLQ